MRILNNLNNNFILKWFLIPLFLLLFWLFLSILYLTSSDFSPTVLSYNHQDEQQIEADYKTNNNEWSGKFKAKDNYLGIVSIEFLKTEKPLIGQISFMIKEINSEEWYEINGYDSRQFYYLKNFPFGFKIIPNSKNKTYEFKFVSESGNKAYQESFKDLNPIVVSKYQYPKQMLISNPFLLISFIYKKILFALSIPSYQKAMFIYSMPLIFYLNFFSLWELGIINTSRIERLISNNLIKFLINHFRFLNNKITFAWFFIVLINIFIINQTLDWITFCILLIEIILFIRQKINSINIFFIVLFLSFFIPIFFLLGFEELLKKLSDWIYYFLLIGVFHALIEMKLNNEKK